MIKKTKHIYIWLPVKTILLIFLVVIIGCSPTRHLKEEEFLLRKNNIEITTDGENTIEKSTLENYYSQKPNTKILGIIPFHLTIYNTLNNGKEKKWKSKLMNVIGEYPVIYDEFLSDKTEEQFKRLLSNKGYYSAEIFRTEDLSNKKASITYHIKTGSPYKIRDVSYEISDSILGLKILSDTSESTYLKKSILLDIEVLEKERDRITKSLKNDGYFNFNKEFITYLVDSTLNSMQADITLKVAQFPQKSEEGLSVTTHKQHIINKVWIHLDMGHSGIISDSLSIDLIPDTINFGKTIFLFNNKPTINPEVILKKISIQPGSIYSSDEVNNSYRHLSGLQQFKFINIQFSKAQTSSDSLSAIDCHIRLNRLTLQSYQIEFEGTNSSTHWGLGGNLLYRHKNIFGGGQIFDMKLSGAFEIQHNAIVTTDDNYYQNTIEYGFESKIIFPGFLAPFNFGRVIEKHHPKSAVFINYNYQDRPDYTRTIVNGGFGYQWKTENNHKHIFNPVELNILTLSDTSAEFSQYFDTLFLRHSYESQFISASSYTYEFSNQNKRSRLRDFIFFRSHSEIAGNIISGINSISTEKTEEGYFELLNNRYAQYVKSDIDLRFYHYLNDESLIAYRGFLGIGIPYGNSNVLPFVKKYFGGGANGIRAWQVRSLGPGSFVDNSNLPDLAADIKLEANVEYRFNIFRNFKGAFFIDAGNIWAVNDYDDREGAQFRLDKFYKEIAVGTGLGARFDFDFILLRIDLGIKVVDPELVEGERLIWGNRKLNSGDYTWNVGIGYPF